MLNRPKPRIVAPLAAALALALTTASAAFAGVTPTQIARLLPAGVVPEDEFAQSLDLDGDIAVVGAPFDDELGEDAGAVYVFRNTDGQWSQEAKLLASNGDEDDEFGSGVAVSGNRIVVTAPRAQNDTYFGGSVHTFTWNGKAWIEVDEFFPSAAETIRAIGQSIAIDGDFIVVPIGLSTTTEGPSSGAAIYQWNNGAWSLENTYFGLDLLIGRGPSVAIDGDVAVLGSYRQGFNQGMVFVLRRSNGAWSEEAILSGSDTLPSEQFGWSIDIDGDTILVGSDERNIYYHRIVYAFRWNGAEWLKEAELMAGPEAYVEPIPNDDVFGYEVAISGDIAIICDRLNIPNIGKLQFNGATYIFKRTGSQWQLIQQYIIDDGMDFETFGSQIAIDGSTALIGNNHRVNASSPPSAAFVVNLCATDLNNDGTTDPADLGILLSEFGDTNAGPTDINNDGVTDTADLGMLLTEFGTPCP